MKKLLFICIMAIMCLNIKAQALVTDAEGRYLFIVQLFALTFGALGKSMQPWTSEAVKLGLKVLAPFLTKMEKR